VSEIADSFKLKNSLAKETVIDACAHVGYAASTQPVRRAAKALVYSMDWLGVARAWIFSLAGATSDHIMTNTDCVRAIREFPDRFDGFGFMNPNYPGEIISELERCREAGLAGILVDPKRHQCGIDSPVYDVLWDYANQNHSIIMGLDWGSVDFLENLLKKIPDTTVICATNGLEYAPLASRFENLFVVTQEQEGFGALEETIRLASAEKVIFGSNATTNDLAGALGTVIFSSLSDDTKRAVLGLNAAAIMERHNSG